MLNGLCRLATKFVSLFGNSTNHELRDAGHEGRRALAKLPQHPTGLQGSPSATSSDVGPEPVATTMYCLPAWEYVIGAAAEKASISISRSRPPVCLSKT